MNVATIATFLLLCFVSSTTVLAKQAGDDCQCRYGTKDGFDGVFHYFETPTPAGKCSDGGNLVCLTEEDDGTFEKDFPGKCKEAKCFSPLDDSDGRVTICHRTCAENNPWVRITIDANAWADHACGHTTESCTGKDLSYWGDYQQDYVLKVHGTREQVAANLTYNVDAINDYWKEWEPACPSVRNGQCCHFDGEHGYTCCGRALEDPPMPAGWSPYATSSPGASPIDEESMNPTNAVTNSPTATPATPPPTATANTVEDSPIIEEPPQCFNRRLQDNLMEERWRLDLPAFRYQRSLSFHMDFEVSDFITDESMISYNVLEADCENSYRGDGLLSTRGLRLPIDTNNNQKVGLAMWVDSSKISSDAAIYSEGINSDGNMQGNVDFCVRFSLNTPNTTMGGSVEVNYLEVIVKFDAYLTDGFEIGTISAEAKDRCERTAQQAYEVEGYFCREGDEANPVLDAPVLNQGDFVGVCVRPIQDALDQGIRMRRLSEFTWNLQGSNLEQKAIENAQPAANGLTEMYCTEGYAICHFQSLLFASFFTGNGAVIGSGVADLQFGGEASPVSVSPRGRRLRESSTSTSARKLQIEPDPAATGVEFSIDFDVAESTFVWGGSSAASLSLLFGRVIMVVSLFAWMPL
mmetsp:Transcript_10462/g.19126  ORF Transcript_10462/g.19126 Transcript_10462/m.19126 type:complete len:636 (+) Transcript_10462:94-2001(+)